MFQTLLPAVMNETLTSTISLQPITWKDKLLLLSPSTWFGFLHQLNRSPFAQFRIDLLFRSILGLLLPLLAFSLSNLDPRIVIPLSPWAIGIIHGGIVPPMKQIYNTAHVWKTRRKNPISASQTLYAERIASGRCVRCGRFDIFLPNTNNSTSFPSHNNIKNALLWLPGALIAHTAYSNVASQLSDAGICVVSVSMEPCRMASPYLGATPRRLKRIQKRVERMLDCKSNNKNSHGLTWSVGGHSLGSFAAMAVAEELKVSSLIMWGSANLRNTRTDLSRSTIPTLVVQGSSDKLCDMDEVTLAEFRRDFPSNTIYKTIQGGGHSWFASIEPGDPSFEGVPIISMEQQQEQAAAITAKFLREIGNVTDG